MQLQLDVHEQLDLALDIFLRSSDRSVRVERFLDAHDSMICGDAALLQNSFLNLALNARDAMPDGGRLVVRTTNRELAEFFCMTLGGGIEPGHYIEVIVEDNGSGIEQSQLERIFDPFYSTKPPGRGTGLGLATVYGTMRRHGGGVVVRSEPGQGTVFTMYLPLGVKACTGEDESAVLRDVPVRGSGSVLVVDDEELVRTTTAAMLKALGYTVHIADNGEHALELLRTDAAVDLVLLDVVMPGLSGPESGRVMREIRPGLKIVFCSGYTRFEDDRELEKVQARGFLHKPFVLADLSRIVAEVIRQPAG
jgi:CheY-like chemotaxis protein